MTIAAAPARRWPRSTRRSPSTASASPSRRRHRRRCAGGRPQRHSPARLGAGARHPAAGPLRVGRGRGGQGRRADGEERQRVRPVPTARRFARHARVPRRGHPAHASAAGREQWFTSDARSVGAARRAVPPDVGAVGRPHDLGAARRPRRRRRRPGRLAATSPRADGPPDAAAASLVDAAVGAGDAGERVRRTVRRRDRRRRRPPQPPGPGAVVDPAVARLHGRIKAEFDPTGRLNPGVDVCSATT